MLMVCHLPYRAANTGDAMRVSDQSESIFKSSMFEILL